MIGSRSRSNPATVTQLMPVCRTHDPFSPNAVDCCDQARTNDNRAGLDTAPSALTRQLRILFLSSGNAARSQIAEAILRRLSRGTIRIASGGIRRESRIHPLAHAAVHRVLNTELDGHYPKLLDEFIGQQFDYVFTLSDQAMERHALFEDARHIHWNVGDPSEVAGGIDERQRAFDVVACQLLKRLRPWWRHTFAEASPLHKANQPLDRWTQPLPPRTAPRSNTPMVFVIYLGTPRRCSNMCGHLRRSGYDVLCRGNTALPRTVPLVVPDAVLVRVDGGSAKGTIRHEFSMLQDLANTVPPSTRLLMLIDHTPSAEEQVALQAMNVLLFWRRPPWTTADLVKALNELVLFRCPTVRV